MSQQTTSQEKIVKLYEKFFNFQKTFLLGLKELVNDHGMLQQDNDNNARDNASDYSDGKTLENLYNELYEIENKDEMDMVRERINDARNKPAPITEAILENVLHNGSNGDDDTKDDDKLNENNLAISELGNLIPDNPDHEIIDKIIESTPVGDLDSKLPQTDKEAAQSENKETPPPPINALYKLTAYQRNIVVRDLFKQARENMKYLAEHDDIIKQNLDEEIQKESDRLLQVYIDSN